MKIKSDSTIHRYKRELQQVIDGDDLVASRLAYFALNVLRRATEEFKGWPPLEQDAIETANLVRKEMNR